MTMRQKTAENKGIYKGRYLYLEILRLLAPFWVVFNHTGAYGYTHFVMEAGFGQWIELFFSCFCTIAVPIFLMISGAVLLGKEEPFSVLLKKRILRILELIVLVSIGNYLYFGNRDGWNMSFQDYLVKTMFSYEICTYYLWLYLGFLLMLPIFRQVVKRRDIIVYICICWLALRCIPEIIEYHAKHGTLAFRNYNALLQLEYIFPLIGYYIHTMPKERVTKSNFVVLVPAAIVSILVNMNLKMNYFTGTGEFLAGYDLLSCSSAATTIFYFAKYMSDKIRFPKWINNLILIFSPTALGTFLLSAVLMWKLWDIYVVLTDYVPNYVAVLIWSFLATVMCQIITAILRLIPPIRKIL